MVFRFFILFATILCVQAPGLVHAQTAGNAAQNTLLPEINPQDIEIRSEFRARFPGLRRQPILGFNPKPRVFRIDPNRMPFMESRDEAVANIAITQLDRPEPPARQIIVAPPRTNGWLQAGIGSFITPEIEGYVFHRVNDIHRVSGNINYRSSDGHLDDQLSSFRYADADLIVNSKVNRTLTIQSQVGYLNDFNRTFNLAPIFQDVIGPTAAKTYSGFRAGVEANQVKNALEGWNASAQFSSYNVEMDAGPDSFTGAFTGTTDEQRGLLSFEKYWPGKRLYETFSVTGTAHIGQYSPKTLSSESWTLSTLAAEYRKLIRFNMHVRANAGIAYVSDGFSSHVYVAPEIALSYNLKDAIVLKGSVSGKPGMISLQEHHQTNRFLGVDAALKHHYTSGAYGEIAFQAIEGNRIYGGLSYEIVKDYAYYDRVTQSRIGATYENFYEVKFETANFFEFYGGITQQLSPEKFWFDARVYARRPSLDSGGDVPFEERLGAYGSVSYQPQKAFTISSWAEFTGKRQAVVSNRSLDAFILLNARASYAFSKNFGAYVKVLNILGQKYELWDGYEERPFQLFGGLTLKI